MFAAGEEAANSPRKEAIFPDPVTPEVGSRLEFFWWGLKGSADGCAAQDGQAQLVNHIQVLSAAVKAGGKLIEDRLAAALHASCLFASILPVGAAIAAAFNAVAAMKDVAGVDEKVRHAVRSRQGLIDQARMAAAGREISIGARSAALAAAENNAREIALVAELVPFAIVVDDAELLDPVTIKMLRLILHSSSVRGLIVLAINSDVPGALTEDKAGHAGSLSKWLFEERSNDNVAYIDLKPMESQALGEIAINDLGILEPREVNVAAMAEVLKASNGSPGTLISLLRTPSVREALIGSGSLPNDLFPLLTRDVLQVSFAALPTEVRRVLASLSTAGPSIPLTWLVDVVSEGASGGFSSREIASATSSGWVTVDQAQILRFSSARAHQVAVKSVQHEVTPDREAAFLARIVSDVERSQRDGSWETLPPDVSANILAALATCVEFPTAWAAELMCIRRLTGRDTSDESLLRSLEERLRTGAPATKLTVATAEALFDAGEELRAINILEAAHE
ncbi:hypothetical protein, partial [Arthrobacter sp. HMWF013]|uniref:hypothetical protein n=1 Tax=Arthrobacter sp. HMWF013 TaxID=2056849 RepID=UPI0011B1E0A0